MRREMWTRWSVAGLSMAAATSALVVLACYPHRPPPPHTRNDYLPECPRSGDWAKRFASKRQNFANPADTELTLAGKRTHVPEFNDCQQFIRYEGAQPKYISLFAIFSLDDLAQHSARFDNVPNGGSSSDSVAVATSGQALAIAEIYALDSAYAPLGIERDFNCLYLYGKVGAANDLEAKMVPVGANEKKCGEMINVDSARGKVLEVHRQMFATAAVPDVARWDWDKTKQQQYIGTGCGKGWCEIGESGFMSSTTYTSAASAWNAPTLAVKGWYDEQQLANTWTNASTGASITSVGAVRGALVPMPGLDTLNGNERRSVFAKAWWPVAIVAIDTSTYYEQKLNLWPSVMSQMSDTVYLCYGQWSDCAPTAGPPPQCPSDMKNLDWWAKIVSSSVYSVSNGTTDSSPTGPSIKYYCVHRRTHDTHRRGFHIPGVVRWRWAVDDETMWIRCLEGCCEVEAGH